MAIKNPQYRISEKLYINHITAKTQPNQAAIPKAIDHILIIDCSGSMSYELQGMREQLKTKVQSLIGEADTLSIIWFSGRSEYGVLLDAAPLRNLKDLSEVRRNIDRWLRPVGLTGFKEPIVEAGRHVAKLRKARPGAAQNVMFLSDGCDNCWPRDEIIKAVKALNADSLTIVEYGYYADRMFLGDMAKAGGGAHIFARNIGEYTPQFEKIVQLKPTGAPGKTIDILGVVPLEFCFTLRDGSLIMYEVEAGKATIPADTADLWYLSTDPKPGCTPFSADPKQPSPPKVLEAVYAAASLYGTRMQPDIVLPLLKALGDVAIIEKFSGCFGKQRYSEFVDLSKAAALTETLRHVKGYNPNAVPRDDAFTALELLQILEKDKENRVLIAHPKFKYTAIGRGSVDSNTVLTSDEQTELEALTEQLKGLKNVADAAKISARIAEITNKPAPLKFVADPMDDGLPVNSIVYNSDRANASIQITKKGTVDISARLAAAGMKAGDGIGQIPAVMKTQQIRALTLIRDGIINVPTLPCRISDTSRAELNQAISEGRLDPSILSEEGDVVLIALDRLPTVNRNQVKTLKAKDFFQTHFALVQAKARQKVLNDFCAALFPEAKKTSESSASLYGEAEAAWLREQGFTDNGFDPKSVQADSTDFYMAKLLKVSFKGYSTLPSLNEWRKSAAAKKLNGPATLMKTTVDELAKMTFGKKKATVCNVAGEASEVPTDEETREAMKKTLQDMQEQAVKDTRALLFAASQFTFSIVVGQTWFAEFKSLDENSMEMDFPVAGGTVQVKATVEQVEKKELI